jgi:hypothetical protein
MASSIICAWSCDARPGNMQRRFHAKSRISALGVHSALSSCSSPSIFSPPSFISVSLSASSTGATAAPGLARSTLGLPTAPSIFNLPAAFCGPVSSMPMFSGPRACGLSSSASTVSTMECAPSASPYVVRVGDVLVVVVMEWGLLSTIPASCSWRKSSPCVTGPVEGSVSPSGCDDAMCATCVVVGGKFSGRAWPPDSIPTVTVSMRPAPLGPSTISVLSDMSSFWPRFCNHGMGVRRAPPRDSSEPRAEGREEPVDVVPLRRPLAVGRTARVRGEETDVTRSRARKYGGRYLYLRCGSRTSSARRWTVCGGCFSKFLDSVVRIDE